MDAHPYAPNDLSLPGFVPNLLSSSTILLLFAVATLVVFSLSWIIPGLVSKTTKMERLLICWWVFTALIHIIVEGYFVFAPEFFKDKTGNYLAEIWKEYSKGDSRYAGRDGATVLIEGITAVVEGPASLLAVYAIAKHRSYSDVLQLAVSLGQLYGCAMYFGTAFYEGNHFAASRYYYYAYFIGANASWVIIPTLISIRSWINICQFCNTINSTNKTKSL
ncbi:putative 3-beta-hydroxysteroid-Delta(8),Delta(7)-isomerase [Silene latifolia]|uniref:putative 3-beta-hydroxysteroid-Delta(8),Delta(7)-isomerase n=1 Tax=Silene latifolia TaxID=37657 RepID=UPI003D77796C